MKKFILLLLPVVVSITLSAQNKTSDTLYYLPCTKGRVVTEAMVEIFHESDWLVSKKGIVNEVIVTYFNDTPKDFNCYIVYILNNKGVVIKSRLIKTERTYSILDEDS